MTSSARRALKVLEIVNSSAEPMGVTAIADAVGTLPGTAYRSLDALERCDFVARYRASTQFQMGSAARRLKQTLYAQFALRNVAIPFLRRLAFMTSDTVSLTVPIGWLGLRLAVVSGTQMVRTAASPGLSGALDEDMGGQAILATFDTETTARFLAEAPPHHVGARDPATLHAMQAEILARGYAVSAVDEGTHHGSVAFPIRRGGRAIAAIGVEGQVIDLATGALPDEWQRWTALIEEIETHVAQLESLQESPFHHLDPAAVTRAICGPIERE